VEAPNQAQAGPPRPGVDPSGGSAGEPRVSQAARPAPVTLSVVLLIIFGAMLALFGLVFVLVGAMFGTLRVQPEMVDQLGPLPESFGGVILGLGLVVLVWGALEVIAAAFVLRRHSWARITAIVLAILGALAGLALSLPGERVNPVGMTVTLAFMGGHAFAIWALSRSGSWFSAA
jgi:hypothetical protein